MTLITVLSLLFLGGLAIQIVKTSKMLVLLLNSERVVNSTFNESMEDYYKYLLTDNKTYLDSSIINITTANRMTLNFATIDQLLKLPEEKYLGIIYHTYEEGLGYDRKNAALVADRINMIMAIKKEEITKLQQVAASANLLGEQIRTKMLKFQEGKLTGEKDLLVDDLHRMEGEFRNFAHVVFQITELINNLLFAGVFIIFIFLSLILILISSFVSRSISIPIRKMVNNFKVIARGNLNTEVSIDSNNEIGQLNTSFLGIQRGMLEVIEFTKKVAEGDHNELISPRSEDDELSIALNKMVGKLKDSAEKGGQDLWFKSGINEMNQKLSGGLSVNKLSSGALLFLGDFLNAEGGAVYHFNSENKLLELVASSNLEFKNLKEKILLNEGIAGQVAIEKRIFNLPDRAHLEADLSPEEALLNQGAIIPLIFDNALIGILELSSANPFTTLELEFINEAAEILAINISQADNLSKINSLLTKTQNQTVELQLQQEELRAINEELIDQTEDLIGSEVKLKAQHEELLKISRYKSEFLANMSHELRTPLNSLLILSNLLAVNKHGNLTPDQVQSAKIIYKSGTDLLSLINEVLDLSKIEAGKIAIDFGMVDSRDIKEEILALFTPVAKEKKLIFEVNIGPGFPARLETDRNRLMQVVKNLLSNAFKFTKEGAIRIDLIIPPPNARFSIAEGNSGNVYCIKVEDSGIGVAGDKLDAIFEAFEQADSSISRRFGGTGLGLSISRDLIKMLGGEIQLESEINRGSIFYIYLPIKQSQNSVAELGTRPGAIGLYSAKDDFIPDNAEYVVSSKLFSSAEAGLLAPYPAKDKFPEPGLSEGFADNRLFKGKKILVVDDEIRTVFALGKILEEREIEVFEAENGALAIEILKANKEMDLVIMDVMMPVMDGCEAIRIIRNTAEIKDVPIICLTAKTKKEDCEDVLNNGASDYLPKPVNEEQLFEMLKIWLAKKQE
ncbi:MAG: response regulator [Mariniphaga sp.]